MTRRRALLIMAGAGGVAALLGYPLLQAPVQEMVGVTESGLTALQWETLGLLVDQIFPPSEGSPSGTAAGVLDYMKRALNGALPGWTPTPASITAGACKPVPGGYRHLIPHYLEALKRLDSLGPKPFQQLTPEQRTFVVERFAQGAKADVGYNVKGVPAAGASDGALFELLRRHTIEGYFCDPANGGNREYVAWESIGHTDHMNYKKARAKP